MWWFCEGSSQTHILSGNSVGGKESGYGSILSIDSFIASGQIYSHIIFILLYYITSEVEFILLGWTVLPGVLLQTKHKQNERQTKIKTKTNGKKKQHQRFV